MDPNEVNIVPFLMLRGRTGWGELEESPFWRDIDPILVAKGEMQHWGEREEPSLCQNMPSLDDIGGNAGMGEL